MKIYTRILGILSTLVVLMFIGLIIYSLFFEKGNLVPMLLLLIPAYILLHFIISNRFGFNIPSESNSSHKSGIIIMSVLFSISLLTIALLVIIVRSKAIQEEDKLKIEMAKLEEMKDLGVDSAVYDFTGHLKTKFIDGNIFYVLKVDSKRPFKPTQTQFIIQFLDKDGFLFNQISIKDFSQFIKNGEIIGIESNSKFKMEITDYNRISKWALLVTTNK